MLNRFRKPLAVNIGKKTEQFAKQYLLNHGLEVIAENVRYKFGEIDLVMREQSHIIFVEVRYRQGTRYGGAVGSINHAKRKRLNNAANAWLQRHDPIQRYRCRFDMIALSGEMDKLHCVWLKNIFQ